MVDWLPAVLAVFGVAICVGAVLWVLRASLVFAFQMCGIGAGQEATSPRGGNDAEVVQHGCGATTTGDYYEVIVRDDRESVFERDEGERSGTQGPVSIQWESEDTLVVYSDPRISVTVQDESSEGVTVRRESSEDA